MTDLFTVAPWVEDIWDWSRNKVDPRKIGKGHHGNLQWICRETGHSYASPAYNVVKGIGCGVCSGHQVLAGFNDLATVRPDLVLEWDYEKNSVSPIEITKSFNRTKVHWICSSGHRWRALVGNRTNPSALAGCPSCARSGYDATKEGLIYFLAQRTGPARKVGITNPSSKTSRIGKLAKDGWDVLATWTGNGDQILAVETVFLAGMRFVDGIPAYFDVSDQVDGFSETFSSDSMEGALVRQSIESLLEQPLELLLENYGRRCRFSVLQNRFLP
ncbi:zinc-ribbon domain-containing protein [Pontimonas sp.]|nr:zinc-ribbon domain-containing protein [Pontimonas sp.]